MNRFTQILYADANCDDVKLFKDAYKDTFRQKKFHHFETAFDLFQFLKNDKSGLKTMVFVDPDMRAGNGLKCTEAIRVEKKFDHIPVIVFSTSDHHADIGISYSAGANLFIKKPISYWAIQEVLLKLFELKWDEYYPQPPYSKFYLK